MTLDHLRQLWADKIEQAVEANKDSQLELQQYRVELHNATWCPDCEREVSELLGLDQAYGFAAIELHSYEDKAGYQQLKQQGKLAISCLPTIQFYRGGSLIGEVLEDSKGGLAAFIKGLS